MKTYIVMIINKEGHEIFHNGVNAEDELSALWTALKSLYWGEKIGPFIVVDKKYSYDYLIEKLDEDLGWTVDIEEDLAFIAEDENAEQ